VLLVASGRTYAKGLAPSIADQHPCTASRAGFMTYMIAICRTYAKGFGAVGAIFAGSECVIEKTRAKHDIYNSVYAGCFTGGALAARAGPQVHFCLSVCLLICLPFGLPFPLLFLCCMPFLSFCFLLVAPAGSPATGREAHPGVTQLPFCTVSGHVRRLRHLRGVLSHDRQVHGARLSAGQGCSPAVRVRHRATLLACVRARGCFVEPTRGANERGSVCSVWEASCVRAWRQHA